MASTVQKVECRRQIGKIQPGRGTNKHQRRLSARTQEWSWVGRIPLRNAGSTGSNLRTRRKAGASRPLCLSLLFGRPPPCPPAPRPAVVDQREWGIGPLGPNLASSPGLANGAVPRWYRRINAEPR